MNSAAVICSNCIQRSTTSIVGLV